MEADEPAVGALPHDHYGADGGAAGGDGLEQAHRHLLFEPDGEEGGRDLPGERAVYYEEGPRAKRYFAALAREDAARTETENFLDKVYGGSLGVMMSAMVGSRALTEEDIAELAAILERAKEETS